MCCFVKQKTAYELRISEWSSDVCSSDLTAAAAAIANLAGAMKELFQHAATTEGVTVRVAVNFLPEQSHPEAGKWFWVYHVRIENHSHETLHLRTRHWRITDGRGMVNFVDGERSEEHTSELQSLMRISYAVFCLKKKKY